LLIGVVAVCLTLAVACSDSSDDAGSASDDTGASEDTGSDASGDAADWLAEAQDVVAQYSESPAETPTAAFGEYTPPEEASIYYIACDLSLEDCALKADASQDAADELGYDFEVCDGGTSADSIGQCFTNAVNADPDVVISNGIGVAEAGDGYAALAEAGIPIVGSSTGNDPGVDGVATEVAGASCEEQGEVMGDWVIADSEGQANVMFFATETYKCNQQRRAGFESSMSACDTCEVSVEEFAIDSIQTTLTQQISSAIQSNPDVGYIIGTFDQIALQASDAVRQSGRDIKVGGFDGNSPNLELISQGDIQGADIAFGRVEPGWQTVDVAARAVDGQDLPEVTPVNFVLITEDNIDQFSDGFDGSEGFQDQLLALWGRD
jgi:ribose transport system substrate-binding protein